MNSLLFDSHMKNYAYIDFIACKTTFQIKQYGVYVRLIGLLYVHISNL